MRYAETVQTSPWRWVRLIAPMLRAPAWLGRRGLRWPLRLCWPYPVIVVTHPGRRSGHMYRTSVELLTGSPGADMFVLPLAGHRSDWYRNIVAGGPAQGSCRGRRGALGWRRASARHAQRAVEACRLRHRRYARALLAVVAHVNDLAATPGAGLAGALPVLVLRFESHGGIFRCPG